MAKYEPLILSLAEYSIITALKLHATDMFPTAKPAGHDWQHIDSQMTLWQHVGGSVLKEPQFAGKVNPMVPFIVSLGHDLNRLPVFMPKSKNATDADKYNHRVRLRMISMYNGLLESIVPSELRLEAMAVLTYAGTNALTPAAYIVCDDLDKAITGHFYAWRCAAVGTGQRVKIDVVKKYVITKTTGQSARLVADERLDSWLGDLEWAEDWDPCVSKTQDFVIRSAVLHEIADPGFEILRRIRSETIEQLQAIGYNY